MNEGAPVSSVPVTKNAILELTIQNTEATDINGVGFTNVVPTSPGSLSVVSVTSFGAGCTAATANPPTSFAVATGTIPASSTCTYRATVTGTVVGTTANSVSVTSSNRDTGTSNTAPLEVIGTPVVTAEFNAVGDAGL